MRIYTLAAMALAAAAFGTGTAAHATAPASPQKLSGPYAHDNLTVYFIHGPSTPGAVPLTLAEAMTKGKIQVRETGSVNNLEIENSGDADIFIQAGDIVKGGQQDRVLTVSMILPARSGKVPIGSFCVEQGRWSKRGTEDVKNFASATEALPSREAKLAMSAPAKAAPPLGVTAAQDPPGRRTHALAGGPRDDTSKRQAEMWDAVSGVQKKLSASVGAPVAAAQSASSLQLSLENDRLKKSRETYVTGLVDKAIADDIVGYVFAINGKINSADVYPSNGLFKKMWPKQIAASATEAIGDARRTASASPTPQTATPTLTQSDVETFLLKAESGKADEKPIGKLARQELRDGDASLYIEARKADGTWVHRNYLAK
jgi:hypothetical protein